MTQNLKTFEDPNIIDIEPVIIEHQKLNINYLRLSERPKKVSQLGSNSYLYSDTKKEKFYIVMS